MEVEVRKMSKFQSFLDTVLEMEEEYPEITDLLSRHETLDAAHRDLVDRQDSAGRKNEELRHELQEFVRVKSDDILARNNEIADLQEECERQQGASRDLLAEAERHISFVADSTLQLGQVTMACENLYSRCVSASTVGRKTPKAAERDAETDAESKSRAHVDDDTRVLLDKLELIKEYVTDLAAISRLARPRETPTPTRHSAERADGAHGAHSARADGARADGARADGAGRSAAPSHGPSSHGSPNADTPGREPPRPSIRAAPSSTHQGARAAGTSRHSVSTANSDRGE